MLFCCLLIFFSNITVKSFFSRTPSESKTVQAQYYVRPDLGPNCLQRLSADNNNDTDQTG